MSEPRPNITLYSDRTANGIKISIALEELGLPYKVEDIDIAKGIQKEPWFLETNPNGRITAITDTFSDGKQIRLFESGTILQYLVEQYDSDHKISYPQRSREQYEVNNWIFFQNAGLGPMHGLANNLRRYAEEKTLYTMERYIDETRRVYKILDKHLESSAAGFLVGDHISTADIATIGWVLVTGSDLEEFPRLKSWAEMMLKRPSVDRGLDVHVKMMFKDIQYKDMSQEEIEEEQKAASQWDKWDNQGHER